jgi:hypothetical protein
MRHEKAGGTAVRRSNRQVPGYDHPLSTNEILDGKVGRVTSVTMGHDVRCGRFGEADCLQQLVKRDALPRGVELRPLGNAVNICVDRRLRERLELRPGPFSKQRSAGLKSEAPVLKPGLRRRSGGKNREIRVTYCPGGTRLFGICSCRLDLNPREIGVSSMGPIPLLIARFFVA